jgi:hypothetical protein
MASATTYFVVEYDTLAGGTFTELSTTLLSGTWDGGASTAFVITDIVSGTTGKMMCALVSGNLPTENDTMTQGAVSAQCDGPDPNNDAALLLYPAYFRRDVDVAADGTITWDTAGGAPNDQVSHSFLFDGQTGNCTAADILTFDDGQECELIEVISDAGASGEYDVRWISFLDTLLLPDDNDGFSNGASGDGDLNMVVHDRAYSALHLHRLLADLNDDDYFTGDDVMYSTLPIPSNKDTDSIVNLLGDVTIADAVSKHLYGGSVTQGSGATQERYSGLNIQITDSDGDTEPVLIQNEAIVTKFWANALNPHSIQGRVRICLKTREDGTHIDDGRITGRLLRYGDTYFTGSTVIELATTALALFSAADNNNQTALGTAQAYTITQTFGFQDVDFSNGNGANAFALEIDFATQTSLETYEKTKANQEEGASAVDLFNRNARLFDGITMDFEYDGESGTITEGATAEVIAWGFEINYGTLAGGTFTIGNVLIGDTSGARGRILYDDGADFAIVALEGTTAFGATEDITEYSAGSATGVTATNTSIVNNSSAGTALCCANDTVSSPKRMFCQRLTGVVPADNQTVFGRTSDNYCDVKSDVNAVRTRVVNNQYVGQYTGSNFITNFGVCIDPSDAIAGDLFPDMERPSVNQAPPDNRTCTITGLESDYYVTCYPWDGTSYDAAGNPEPDFDEMSLNGALTQGVSTVVDVGTGNIPDNTSQTGFLRIANNDATPQYFLWEYTSHDGDDEFTMSGTAPYSANSANNVMRAPLDEVSGGTQLQWNAVIGTPNQWAIAAKRGGGVSPIKPALATATFPFDVNIQAQSDA